MSYKSRDIQRKIRDYLITTNSWKLEINWDQLTLIGYYILASLLQVPSKSILLLLTTFSRLLHIRNFFLSCITELSPFSCSFHYNSILTDLTE